MIIPNAQPHPPLTPPDVRLSYTTTLAEDELWLEQAGPTDPGLTAIKVLVSSEKRILHEWRDLASRFMKAMNETSLLVSTKFVC